ncbi:Hypothetical protein FKW44_020845 [Caligus rogercresseyi]|uniref:Uncharacterized protein n=1 Tax=Caligus rogercresseyi TaxID=217165 RepID=A0A7T8JVC4_CALRO|nr:Hypothetical protein FKW44_020845 [Caligus rogercresseyi]
MPWTPRNESSSLPPLRDTFPSPRLREWSPTHRRSSSVKGLPSLIFVRELPVPLFVNGALPSSDFVRELPILVFVRQLPVPFLREGSPTPRRTSLESSRSLPPPSSSLEELPIPRLRPRTFLPSSSLESSPFPSLREWSPTPHGA